MSYYFNLSFFDFFGFSIVTSLQLFNCGISPDGGTKCMTMIIRRGKEKLKTKSDEKKRKE